mmetsp:Transcript_29464/g.46270  ORF Transcript_29464/g.46270 Transcript_29464/m.46270 type:complete len:406 (-) Transcript_29464:192-1409(-)|eukprot:CAMPEP_0201717886 /NCGR_PEP_ID=MMETSP0593-20130828/3549_1 /ASSEMBLY_ACC=CAM_ASM_000672 /TAXON_ID=267983 /ORGANISM="Skeletonema japonicum, Strain CCMP2506" /LENGTH=405 /DNA_ID=CAMNT_0048208061 /DNA_START=270 /DNA_END=1487 /DNA_ORIENTATION=-
MSPPSDSDILVITTESDNTQDSTKILYTKKETECLSDDSSDPVIDVTNSAEDQEEVAAPEAELGGEKKDPPSLEPSTMDTVLSEESVEATPNEIDFRQTRLSIATEKKLEADVNNIANYIDIKKVVGKNESNYYYTPKNRSTRQTIAKIKKTKKGRSEEVDNLDTSQHSKLNILDGCSDRSSYFGPTATLSDGSPVEGILKNRAYFIRNQRRFSSRSERSDSSTRSVELKTVHIREHERIAGDNPCVSSGVPLSLGWGFVQHDPFPLDDYESAKGPPRDKIEMMVPASVRKCMLRDEFKVSIAELNASMKVVNITKKQRRHTVASEHLEGWQEVSESAKRKFKRLLNKSSTKKEEAALWEQAHTSATQSFLKTFGADALAQNPELAGVDVNATEMPKEISIQAEK